MDITVSTLVLTYQRPCGEALPLTELSACVLKKGVFPVWYETARHPAIFGQYREIRQSGVTTALQTFGEPTPLETLPKPLTLLDLACSCPTLFYERADLGIQSRLARARLAVDYFQDRNLYILDLIIHPTAAELVDQIGKRIRFSARCADLVQPKEFYSGGGFRVEHPFDADYVDIEFPTSYTLHGEECLFTAEEAPLNEFGIYYMASYIAGMFARYYPEYWARGVEANDRTFRVVDALMSHALSRAPLLLLGELGNKYYVYFQ
jgi:hypothetical protein